MRLPRCPADVAPRIPILNRLAYTVFPPLEGQPLAWHPDLKSAKPSPAMWVQLPLPPLKTPATPGFFLALKRRHSSPNSPLTVSRKRQRRSRAIARNLCSGLLESLEDASSLPITNVRNHCFKRLHIVHVFVPSALRPPFAGNAGPSCLRIFVEFSGGP